MIAFIIITLLIVLYAYFSMAEIALISISDGELADEKYAGDPRTSVVLRLIRNPEEFLSAVQVGMTLVGMLEALYGGALIAEKLETWLVHLGASTLLAHISSLIVGIGAITYLTIVFGELVPKSIALQIPMKVSLAIAPSLHLFSKVAYPLIKILTATTHYIISFLHFKKSGNRKLSEKDLMKVLSTAYQQGVFSKQQLWLHQNVITFKKLTAQRIMKPARIVVSIAKHWDRQQVKDFIRQRPYSYFPVYQDDETNIIGIVRTKEFLFDEDSNWQKNMLHACTIAADALAKDIFDAFKEKKQDFGIVTNQSNQYIGIVAMQDIMEGVFGDMPEIEDYSAYFYPDTEKIWIAEGFIHLQRVRNKLNLSWLRDYEIKYLSLSELIMGETENLKSASSITINGVTFEALPSTKGESGRIKIMLP